MTWDIEVVEREADRARVNARYGEVLIEGLEFHFEPAYEGRHIMEGGYKLPDGMRLLGTCDMDLFDDIRFALDAP